MADALDIPKSIDDPPLLLLWRVDYLDVYPGAPRTGPNPGDAP